MDHFENLGTANQGCITFEAHVLCIVFYLISIETLSHLLREEIRDETCLKLFYYNLSGCWNRIFISRSI